MSADALASVLLGHPDPLPGDLLTGIAATCTSNPVREALLRRVELPDEAFEDIVAAAGESNYTSLDVRCAILARRTFADGAELENRLVSTAKLSRSGARVDTVVRALLAEPLLTDEVHDLLANSTDPRIVAAYARHTPRGPSARDAALARLEGLLGPDQRRVPLVASECGGSALAHLLREAPDLGRKRLLKTRTRAVLLALSEGDDDPHALRATMSALDAACRAHLIEFAVLPVLTTLPATGKDLDAAGCLTRAMLPDLDTDVLEALANLTQVPPAWNWTRGQIVAELRQRRPDPEQVAALQLTHVATWPQNRADKAHGAVWLLDRLADVSRNLGWPAAFRLADELDKDATLADVGDFLAAIAQPAETA